jgi:hypothetical protein
VSYSPRKTGTAASVLWTCTDFSGLIFSANATKTITARFQDLTNPAARVGATAVIPLVEGVDYIAIHSDGVTDVSHTYSASMVVGANSAEITLSSNNPFASQITQLQVRGTPLTTFDPQTVTSMNIESIQSYKDAPERIEYRLIDNANDAQSIANFRVNRNAQSLGVFDKIGIYKDKSSTRLDNGLNNDVGERITITDTWLNHSADYFVVGYRHQVVFGGDSTHGNSTHTAIYTLKPAERDTFWILGTSLLGTNTKLAL